VKPLLAFRAAVAVLMVLLAFEWGTRLHALGLTTIPADAPHRATAAALLAAVAVLWFVVFGVASWRTTARIESGRASRRALALLSFQLLVGWTGSFELLVLVCLQAPFLLAGRALASFLALAAALPLGQAGLELSSGLDPSTAVPLFPGVHPLAAWLLTRLYTLAWMGAGAAIGWTVTRAVRSGRELLRMNAEVRASREMLAESARIAERLHLARELHDVIGHHLAALSQHLELARRRTSGEAADAVAGALRLVRGLLDRLRRAVSAMRRAPTLELAGALRALASAAEVDAELRLPADARLPPARTEALFDCAREAVGAAVVAGGRPRVTVELGTGEGTHVLTVSVDPSRAAPLGEDALRRLRERLSALGGQLEAGSLGAAFRLRAELPDGEGAS
jgi:signal transduction histidine kinase